VAPLKTAYPIWKRNTCGDRGHQYIIFVKEFIRMKKIGNEYQADKNMPVQSTREMITTPTQNYTD
jgi:hypothetical protein